MARTYAKLKASIWRDPDWTTLPAAEQRVYLLLLSQPEITNCGVIPYLPTRWARMAPDTTLDGLFASLAELARKRYVVIDDHACELLVRTYVKHDQVLEQPKLAAAARRQFDQIQSSRIRTVLATEHPDAFGLNTGEKPYPEPYSEPFPQPYAEGYGEASRAGARATPTPVPTPLPVPTPAAPGSGEAYAATPAAADDDERLATKLAKAGWTPAQAAITGDELRRAAAWLEHCEADPTCQKPGALAWTKFQAGGWPTEQRATLATGATGTRSARQDRATDPTSVCPDCGEKLGHGHLETCPRMPQLAPEPEPEPEREPEPPPPARRRRRPSDEQKQPEEATA